MVQREAKPEGNNFSSGPSMQSRYAVSNVVDSNAGTSAKARPDGRRIRIDLAVFPTEITRALRASNRATLLQHKRYFYWRRNESRHVRSTWYFIGRQSLSSPSMTQPQRNTSDTRSKQKFLQDKWSSRDFSNKSVDRRGFNRQKVWFTVSKLQLFR